MIKLFRFSNFDVVSFFSVFGAKIAILSSVQSPLIRLWWMDALDLNLKYVLITNFGRLSTPIWEFQQAILELLSLPFRF